MGCMALILNSRTASILSHRLTFCECGASAVFAWEQPLKSQFFPLTLIAAGGQGRFSAGPEGTLTSILAQ